MVILAAVREHEVDGIQDYTRYLSATLALCPDVQVTSRNPRLESVGRFTELLSSTETGVVTVLLQYNPFTFARWGFAPWLPVKLWRMKRRSPRLQIGLMVHETYVPIVNWRSALMGAWQRAQFFAVWLITDMVFTSITAWAAELRERRPRRPVYHLPVASNLPDMRHARPVERKRLGADDKTIVLATFGSNHPSRRLDYVAAASEAVASAGFKTILLNLGFNAPSVRVGAEIKVIKPGPLEDVDVARLLAAADVYLAPFTDGASTRRGTLMSALQHGLPVVSTDGILTDRVLRDAHDSLWLTPADDSAGFVRAATSLAKDPEARSCRGALGRALYEREFDWAVLAKRLVERLSE